MAHVELDEHNNNSNVHKRDQVHQYRRHIDLSRETMLLLKARNVLHSQFRGVVNICDKERNSVDEYV
jgi:hypothetical protein